MKDKLFLLFYAAAVIVVTSYHNIMFLAGFLVVMFVLSGAQFLLLFRKAFFAVVFFNSIISVSYLTVSLIQGHPWAQYIVLINLRVFLLTFMGFFIINRVNLFKALSFSSTMTFILVLAGSQILTFKKIYDDFAFALKSRVIKRAQTKDLHNYISSMICFFLNKSVNNSREVTQAMRSRGFFGD